MKLLIVIVTIVILPLLGLATVCHSQTIKGTMYMDDCKEMFAMFNVDPEIARQNVPLEYDVKIYENGMAMLGLLVQNCRECILDNLINVGFNGSVTYLDRA